MMIQDILYKMIEYDAGDVPRIQHFIKVYTFAHMIGEKEGLDEKTRLTLDIASILHDIGIHCAEKKYGSSNGKYQEELGPDEARKMLNEYELESDIVDRVCFLIGHHHTYDQVDGIDYQILLEADFLVNSFEENLKQSAIHTARERVFKSKTGTATLDAMWKINAEQRKGSDF